MSVVYHATMPCCQEVADTGAVVGATAAGAPPGRVYTARAALPPTGDEPDANAANAPVVEQPLAAPRASYAQPLQA